MTRPPQDEPKELSEDYLDNVLEKHGGFGPKTTTMPEEQAEQRIRVEIAKMPDERQHAGLWSINKVLKQEGVAPSVRLHLITANVHLSLLAKEQRVRAPR